MARISSLVSFSILLVFAAGIGNTSGKATVTQKGKSYDGYQVIRAFATQKSQLHILGQIRDSSQLYVDFWTEPKLNSYTDVMVDEKSGNVFKAVLEKNDIRYEILHQNLQSVISDQQEERAKFMSERSVNADFDWEQYYPLETIQNFLATLDDASNATKVEILTIGKSGEGRNMTVAKISKGSANDAAKPSIFITATIHAREWIAAATATYIINQLATNSSAHPDILDAVNFYILPVINPDGYSYSHTTDRLWRKTRSNHNSPLNCRGADANRNFAFKWNDGEVSGSSGDKCSETYRGPEPFSEPEAKSIEDFVGATKNSTNWAVYMTVHSYGQYFMAPWGYTKNLPENYPAMKTLSDNAVAALSAKYGTKYTTGSSANVLYYTDGTDQDWALGSGHFNYSYTMELRDTGSYGFLLPVKQIIPTAEETWEAIKVVARNFA